MEIIILQVRVISFQFPSGPSSLPEFRHLDRISEAAAISALDEIVRKWFCLFLIPRTFLI